MFTRMSLAKLSYALTAVFGSALTVNAQVSLYDSGGFESPRFVASTPSASAPLEGQDLLFGPWQRTLASDPAIATVETLVGIGGSNAVRFENSGGNDDTQYLVSKPAVPITPLNSVLVTWSQNTAATNINGLEFGPFFGVEVFDASNPANIKQIGGFGVDASTGDLLVLVGTPGAAFYAPLETPQTVSFDQYQSLAIVANYTDKTYTVSLGGIALETDPFIDSTATAFTDAPISTRFVSNAGENSINEGLAFFDDYAIAVVPEPSMMAALSIAAGFMSARRR